MGSTGVLSAGQAAVLLACAVLGCGGDGGGAPGPAAGRVLIVAAEPLAEVAEEYAAFRAELGFEVEVATSAALWAAAPADGLGAELRRRVQAFAAAGTEGQESFVLLLGDADARQPDSTAHVPAARGPRGDVGDTPYADLDGDGLPELAIGRVPFGSAADVRGYLGRLRAHEAGYRPGAWNKTLSAFAGEGGFGPEIDGMLELAAGWVFDEMSYDFDMSMTYASPSSSYHLPPAAWEAAYAERYLAGAVIQPYIGHTLGAVECCRQAPARSGLLGFFSCSDGEYQADGAGSLAEELLGRPGGPVAILAASDVSHPYANAILPRELGHALLDLRARTYGEAVLVAKRNMVERQDDLRRSLDQLAAPYLDEPMEDCIQSHVSMYNLFGDPAAPTHLPPGRVRFDPPGGQARPGGRLELSGRVGTQEGRAPMAAGRVVVTLEVSRTVVLGELAPPGPETYAANHALANDKVAARAEGEVTDGQFALALEVPADLPAGSYHLKAYAWDEAADSVGNLRLQIAE